MIAVCVATLRLPTHLCYRFPSYTPVLRFLRLPLVTHHYTRGTLRTLGFTAPRIRALAHCTAAFAAYWVGFMRIPTHACALAFVCRTCYTHIAHALSAVWFSRSAPLLYVTFTGCTTRGLFAFTPYCLYARTYPLRYTHTGLLRFTAPTHAHTRGFYATLTLRSATATCRITTPHGSCTGSLCLPRGYAHFTILGLPPLPFHLTSSHTLRPTFTTTLLRTWMHGHTRCYRLFCHIRCSGFVPVGWCPTIVCALPTFTTHSVRYRYTALLHSLVDTAFVDRTFTLRWWPLLRCSWYSRYIIVVTIYDSDIPLSDRRCYDLPLIRFPLLCWDCHVSTHRR